MNGPVEAPRLAGLPDSQEPSAIGRKRDVDRRIAAIPHESLQQFGNAVIRILP